MAIFRLFIALICLPVRESAIAGPIPLSLSDLVIVNSYQFSDKSSLNHVVKDGTWHQSEQDSSAYWSANQQDNEKLNATILPFVYSADKKDRRKLIFIGFLGGDIKNGRLPIAGQPDPVPVTTNPSTLTSVNTANIKPPSHQGPLKEAIFHGVPIEPGMLPPPPIQPSRPPINPPKEVTLPQPIKPAAPPLGSNQNAPAPKPSDVPKDKPSSPETPKDPPERVDSPQNPKPEQQAKPEPAQPNKPAPKQNQQPSAPKEPEAPQRAPDRPQSNQPDKPPKQEPKPKQPKPQQPKPDQAEPQPKKPQPEQPQQGQSPPPKDPVPNEQPKSPESPPKPPKADNNPQPPGNSNPKDPVTHPKTSSTRRESRAGCSKSQARRRPAKTCR